MRLVLDLSGASRGAELEFHAGPRCGEEGNTLDYLIGMDDGDVLDSLDEARGSGYVELRIGSRLWFIWGPVYASGLMDFFGGLA